MYSIYTIDIDRNSFIYIIQIYVDIYIYMSPRYGTLLTVEERLDRLEVQGPFLGSFLLVRQRKMMD